MMVLSFTAFFVFSSLDLDAPIVKASVTIRNGSTSTIECSVEGLPKPAISWKKGGALVSSQSTLTWNPILKNDAGAYFCLGANKIGTKQSQTAVTVTCKYIGCCCYCNG